MKAIRVYVSSPRSDTEFIIAYEYDENTMTHQEAIKEAERRASIVFAESYPKEKDMFAG